MRLQGDWNGAKPVWIAFDRRHIDDADRLAKQHLKIFYLYIVYNNIETETLTDELQT